jgi:hypothetical protein
LIIVSAALRPIKRGSAIVALLCVALFCGFGLMEAGARFLYPQWNEFSASRFISIAEFEGIRRLPTGRPGFSGWFSQNNGDFRVRIDINADGYRMREPLTQADGAVWAVGDSFMFGWGVESDATMANVAARETGKPVYNLASPGTAVCGYILQIARGLGIGVPKAVVVSITLENDLVQKPCGVDKDFVVLPDAFSLVLRDQSTGDAPTSLHGWKLFLMKSSALYNLAAVAVKRSPMLRNALMSAGLVEPPHSVHKMDTSVDLENHFSAMRQDLNTLSAMLPSDVPRAVLLIPSRFDLRDDDEYDRRALARVAEIASDAGFDVIDPSEAFREMTFENVHFTFDGHWTAAAHARAGRMIAEWMQQAGVR